MPLTTNNTFDAINPSTGEIFTQIPEMGVEGVEKAIAQAREAFDSGPWPQMSFAQRGIYLKKIAKVIRQNAKELALIESKDIGKTIKHTTFIDVPTCADTFDYFSSIDEKFFQYEVKVNAPVKSTVVQVPRGVIASVIPWNYPLIMAAWKLAPALITGNTIVLKPSEIGCASVIRLAELIAETGIPEGVVNIVSTQDLKVAQGLIESADIDMISFTGSEETGKKILNSSSTTLRKVSLELGGKSPNIVFADCNIDAALGGVLSAIFMNQGQMCTAGSRLFIEEKIYDEFMSKLIDRTKSFKIGDATEQTTEFGPLVSEGHRNRVAGMVSAAVKEGAQIVCGGKVVEGASGTAYYEPTILGNVTNDMKVAQDEVFGPVLCVMKFKMEDEVVKLSNDSKYGLAAMVWTRDEEKASRISKQLQCGTVWVNTYGGFYNEVAFGGFKQSGFGRELGVEGLLEYTQSKHICVDQTPGGMPLAASWF